MDTQIKQDCFLEDVDGLLNAGAVANLYAIDEKQDIIEVCILYQALMMIWTYFFGYVYIHDRLNPGYAPPCTKCTVDKTKGKRESLEDLVTCCTIDIRDYVHGIGNLIIAQTMFVTPFFENVVRLSCFTQSIRGAKANTRKHHGNQKMRIGYR